MKNGLLIRAERQAPLWEKLLSAGVAGAAVGMFTAEFVSGRWWVPLSVLAAIFGFAGAIRAKRAELRATNVEFLTKGNAATRFRQGQTVCTGDVRWLEFQEDTGGPDSYEPSGLYAITARGSKCLLPFLSEEETAQVITEIEGRFPGLAERWRKESPFGENFLSLGIAKAK